MKKLIFILALLLVTIITLQQVNPKGKNDRLTELMRMNIESLATPENHNMNCVGRGTVDCPALNVQVMYYF